MKIDSEFRAAVSISQGPGLPPSFWREAFSYAGCIVGGFWRVRPTPAAVLLGFRHTPAEFVILQMYSTVAGGLGVRS